MLQGENIRIRREQRKKTQEWLAEQLDMSPKTISLYEKDERKPTLTVLAKIALLLDTSLDYLCDRNSDYKNESIVDTDLYKKLENRNPAEQKKILDILTLLVDKQ